MGQRLETGLRGQVGSIPTICCYNPPVFLLYACVGVGEADPWPAADSDAGTAFRVGTDWASIQAAADAAGRAGGGIVSIPEGEWSERLIFDQRHDGVTLLGDEGATLAPSDLAETDMAVRLDGNAGTVVTLQHLRVSGGAGHGLTSAGGTLTLLDMVVEGGPRGVGIAAEGTGAHVDARGLAITGTQRGVQVRDGGTATVADSTIRDAEFGAVVESAGSGLGLDAVEFIGGTDSMTAKAGAILVTKDVSASGAQNAGVACTGGGTNVRGVRTTLRDLGNGQGQPGAYGFGVLVESGCHVLLTDLVVETFDFAGVHAAGPDAVVSISGCLIRDGDPTGNVWAGVGISSEAGAVVTARDCALSENRYVGLYANAATLTASRVSVRDTRTVGPNLGGIGFYSSQSTVSYTDIVSEGNAAGLIAFGGALTVERASVGEPNVRPSSRAGHGIELGGDLDAVLTDVVVADAVEAGIVITGPARSYARNILVRGTTPSDRTAVGNGVFVQTDGVLSVEGLRAEGNVGVGLVVSDWASVHCRDCVLAGNRFAGAAVNSSTLVLVDAVIEGNLPDGSLGGGMGIYAEMLNADALLSVDGTVVGPHAYAALWFDGPGAYHITDSDVSGSPGVQLREGLVVHGNAVYAQAGAVPTLTRDSFHGADIAVLLDGAGALFDATTFANNRIDVRQQTCVGGAVVVSAITEICPTDSVLTLTPEYAVFLMDPLVIEE